MGYVATGVVLSATVFCLVWWVLTAGGEELPGLPAGLAASFVLLLTLLAREMALRRRWARLAAEARVGEAAPRTVRGARSRQAAKPHSSSNSLRVLQQRLAEAAAAGAQQPEAHLEAYHLCEQYLAKAEEAIRSNRTAPDARFALHAGKERVRELQKQHLLAWAREEARRLTTEARRRVRVSDKIETAQRAVDAIDEALKVYPEEPELKASAQGARDFVASLRVAHWVELAERSAFRGRYRRAIARYRDALFYVSRAEMSEESRADTASRIDREIELLRARVATGERVVKQGSAKVVRAAERAAEGDSAAGAMTAEGAPITGAEGGA